MCICVVIRRAIARPAQFYSDDSLCRQRREFETLDEPSQEQTEEYSIRSVSRFQGV